MRDLFLYSHNLYIKFKSATLGRNKKLVTLSN